MTHKRDSKIKYDFIYTFAPETYKKDRDLVRTDSAKADSNAAILKYTMFGFEPYRGEMSIISAAPAKISFREAEDFVIINTESIGIKRKFPHKRRDNKYPYDCAVFENELSASPNAPFETVFFMTYYSNDTPAYSEAAAKTRTEISSLGVDANFAARLRTAAASLRKSLPNDGQKYIPYEGSKNRSINVVGGLFPYPVFDENEPMLKRAVYDFFENINEVGNMYDVGK